MKRFGLLLLAVMLVCSLAACKHDSDDDDLVTIWAYSKYTDTNGNSYHRIAGFNCTDKGNNIYDVQTASYHFFSMTNPRYTNLSKGALVGLAKNNYSEASQKGEYEHTSDNTISLAPDTLYIHAGSVYQIYYYY